MNCLHRNIDRQNKCGLLRDDVPCKGPACEWYTTREMQLKSLMKAARTWKRNHPGEPLTKIMPDKWLTEIEGALTSTK